MTHRLAPLALSLLLAACAAGPVAPGGDSDTLWQAHRAEAAAVQAWNLSGRIAILTGEEGWHASIAWRQQGEAYRLRLTAPLGQGTVMLDGAGERVTLRTSEGESVSDADAEALLYRQLGWRVPVAALRYWVRGIPAPGGAEAVVLNDAGRLERLNQRNWQVRLYDYAVVDGVALPGKVFVENHKARVRLVIDRWELTGVAPV